jgi:hypothetical protein
MGQAVELLNRVEGEAIYEILFLRVKVRTSHFSVAEL